MPRDLASLAAERKGAVDDMPPLQKGVGEHSSDTPSMAAPTESPEQTTPSPSPPEEQHTSGTYDQVKPYVQSLTMLDVESCTKLEEATFPPQERCSKDKVSRCRVISLVRFCLSFSVVFMLHPHCGPA